MNWLGNGVLEIVNIQHDSQDRSLGQNSYFAGSIEFQRQLAQSSDQIPAAFLTGGTTACPRQSCLQREQNAKHWTRDYNNLVLPCLHCKRLDSRLQQYCQQQILAARKYRTRNLKLMNSVKKLLIKLIRSVTEIIFVCTVCSLNNFTKLSDSIYRSDTFIAEQDRVLSIANCHRI